MKTLHHRGCDLAYRVEGSGPPVLLIQGVGVHGDGWSPQIDALRSSHTLLSFDNRGVNASQPAGDVGLTIDQMVDDALTLVEAQGWERCHVVGHSMGGHIAAALALASPGRVRSLALLCTSARGRDMPPVTASFLWTSLRTRLGTRRARRSAFLEIVLPRTLRGTEDLDAWAARLEPVFGHDLADTPAIAMRQIRAYRQYDGTSRLGALASVPTLVVSATEDPLAPPALGRALADAIPGARFVEIADAAHGVTVSHAERVNELLLEHWDAAEQSTPTRPETS